MSKSWVAGYLVFTLFSFKTLLIIRSPDPLWNSIPEVLRKLPKQRFKKKITKFKSLFHIFLKEDSYVDIDTLLNEMKRIYLSSKCL